MPENGPLREAGPPTLLSLSAGASAVRWDEGLQVYGGPAARVHVPVTGLLFADIDVALPLTRGPDGAEQGVFMLPTAMAGLVLRWGGQRAPWASIDGLFISDATALRPGIGGAVGIDVPAGGTVLTPEVRGGWAGVTIVGLSRGVCLGP